MIPSAEWQEAARAVQAEGFCMLMCLDRGNGQPLELWLRTESGTVLTTTAEVEVPSLSSVWPEAKIKEREIHEAFGVHFDLADSHAPLLLSEAVRNKNPMRKSVLLASRNEVPWPGAKDPSDSSTSPSRRKSLPMGVVSDMSAHDGEFL